MKIQARLAAFLFLLVFGAVLTLAVVPPAVAQGSDTTVQTEPRNADASARDIESLIQTLENSEARQKLVEQLRTLLEAQGKTEAEAETTSIGARLINALAARAKEADEVIQGAIIVFRDASKVGDWFRAQVDTPATRQEWVNLIYKLIIVLIAAVAAGWIVRSLLAHPRRAVEGRAAESYIVRLLFLVIRTFLDFIPVVAAAAAAHIVLPLTEPRDQTRLAVVTVITAYVLAEGIMVLARMVLAPRVEGLRFIPAGGETSNYLYVWARRFTYLWVYVYYLVLVLGALGLPPASQHFITLLLGLVIATLSIIFVLQNRKPFADFLRTEDEISEHGHPLVALRNRLADVWHALTIIYISAVFLIWALRVENGFENFLRSSVVTVLAIIVAMLVGHVIQRGVARGFSVSDDVKTRYPGLEDRANRYLPLLNRVLRLVITLVAITVILEAWGADVLGWFEGPAGERVLSAAVSIIIVLVVALVAWEGASAAIERYLNKTELDSSALARRDRARTLLPLLRNVLMFTISVLVILVVLAELGVSIGPLLAGAGIVGLAIGFGSQKLVQDVITGGFIVFEDAVAVGDVVTVAGTSGRVEGMSIRSIRLRDLSGNVHNIPFSAVDTVTNMTKEFSFYVFEVGIAYRESVDEVMDVLRGLGQELKDDPDFGPKIIEPLEILGVDAFADSAVIIKCRFKTMPIEQWVVGREFNRRMKNKFDELGIEIPFPHQTIYMGVDKDGNAPSLNVRTDLLEKVAETQSSHSQPSGGTGAHTPTSTPSDSGQQDQGN